jgi:hypothetical protein
MAVQAQKKVYREADDRDSMIEWSRAVHALAIRLTPTDPRESIMVDLIATAFKSLAPVSADQLRRHVHEQGCGTADLQMGLNALESAKLIEHLSGGSYRINYRTSHYA